jgi:hypothetical protein
VELYGCVQWKVRGKKHKRTGNNTR